jgi:predicted CoA-binding protein
MVSQSQINEFLSQPAIGIAGVSRNNKRFGYMVYTELKKKGLKVYPVNPNSDMIDEDKCYRDINSLPSEVNSILIVTPKKTTGEIVKQAVDRNIKHIWIQQGSGTKEDIELAKKSGINVISGLCIFMAADPVQGFHKFHKVISKFFGGYPKN